MTLTSHSFSANQMIPKKCTCDGANISPHLAWHGAPISTKSFALSCTDPDAPGGTFIHWLVYDIPFDVKEISEGTIPMTAKQVENDFGQPHYGGPCPPPGTHRYVFTLYALSTEHLDGVNKENFFSLVSANKVDQVELIGLYQRQTGSGGEKPSPLSPPPDGHSGAM